MTRKIGNEPAFARQASTDEHDKPCNVYQDQEGLTKREYIAALAMQAYIVHHGSAGPLAPMAADARDAADALCEALENSND